MNTRLFTFVGGDTGLWRVVKSSVILGEALSAVARLDVVAGADPGSKSMTGWSLRGIISNDSIPFQYPPSGPGV